MFTARGFEAVAILLVLAPICLIGGSGNKYSHPAATPSPIPLSSSGLTSDLSWLAKNLPPMQSGFEGSIAAVAYALWLNSSDSSFAEGSYAFLAKQLDDSSAWFWSGGHREASVSGFALFGMAAVRRLGLVQNLSSVSSRLLRLQLSTGGFEGYFDPTVYNPATSSYGRIVTSSADTAMALWGLSHTGFLPQGNRTAAINYLLTLQNPDGSFNLTRTTEGSTYPFGPDKDSITALVLLVLRDNGFNFDSPPISKALNFLAKDAIDGFGGPGHVYAGVISSLAFLQYYHPKEAVGSLTYLMTQQNSDGGFGDVSRPTPGSDALDTGLAAVALQYSIIEHLAIPGPLNRVPTARFTLNTETPVQGTVVSFDASSSSDQDGDSLSYEWTFGDGSSASGPTVTHVYQSSGAYTVTLTVIDSGHNPDSLSNTTWETVRVQQSHAPLKTASTQIDWALWLTIALPMVLVAAIASLLGFRYRKKK